MLHRGRVSTRGAGLGALLLLVGCSGDGPALPGWLYGKDCRSSACDPPSGMVEVPAGSFEMGSELLPNERPIRQVDLDAFWIDELEVSVDDYAVCVSDGACAEPTPGSCNWGSEGRGDHPMNCVSWFDAEDYCSWADDGRKRLPTEAEWEKAARGTDARMYPWGDSPQPSCAHVVMLEGGSGCGTGSTMPVGSKPMGVSPYGVHDMAGNIAEWVWDRYGFYDAEDTDNPEGAETGYSRTGRGGAWSSAVLEQFRTSFRDDRDPAERYIDFGFRCARTPPE